MRNEKKEGRKTTEKNSARRKKKKEKKTKKKKKKKKNKRKKKQKKKKKKKTKRNNNSLIVCEKEKTVALQRRTFANLWFYLCTNDMTIVCAHARQRKRTWSHAMPKLLQTLSNKIMRFF